MRILVLSNMLPSQAHPFFGVFVARRIASYRSLGADVDVVANTESRKGPARVVVKYLRLLLAAVWAAGRRRPGVVEAHYLFPTAIIAAIVGTVFRRPFVLVAHGSDVDLDHGGLVAWVMTWAVGRASGVVANSPATAATVEARYPGVVVEVIPPGVTLGEPADKRLTGSPIVGFIGTLADHKGPDLVLDALPLLPHDVRARVVGRGPQEESLRQQTRRLGLDDRVEFVEAVPPSALHEFYRSIDVLAVPSRREGFGLVAAEALAAGTPVVVSDVGGLPSIPVQGCGSIVPPDDPQRLAEAIALWLRRRGDQSVSQACRTRAAEFDELGLARRSLALLESMAQ